MTEHQSSEDRTHLNPPGTCFIPGCTSPSVATRWVPLGARDDREIEVCAKHADGELDPEIIALLTA